MVRPAKSSLGYCPWWIDPGLGQNSLKVYFDFTLRVADEKHNYETVSGVDTGAGRHRLFHLPQPAAKARRRFLSGHSQDLGRSRTRGMGDAARRIERKAHAHFLQGILRSAGREFENLPGLFPGP